MENPTKPARFCKRCHYYTVEGHFQYCKFCGPIVRKRLAYKRNKRYREKHHKELLKKEQEYRDGNREVLRLRARNYMHQHEEERREALIQWRGPNPRLKRKEQRQREWKNKRKRLRKIGYKNGLYLSVKGKVDESRVTPCRCCGREIPYQGRGPPRTYCETCFPQIAALRKALSELRYEREGKSSGWKKWYVNNKEIVVAVTCIFCDDIIIGKRGKKLCRSCQTKWAMKIPRHIMETLEQFPSFHRMPKDLLAWHRIHRLRVQGITKLSRCIP